MNQTTPEDLVPEMRVSQDSATAPNGSLCSGGTTEPPIFAPSSHDALLYIVVVLLFYACSMVILMIKYVRREQEEAEMAHYYSEYVARDKFKAPMFQIRTYMQRLREVSERRAEDCEDVMSDLDDEDYVSCVDISLVNESSPDYQLLDPKSCRETADDGYT